MRWEWVVPVIVLVVWILTNVLRPAEEQNKLQPQRQLPEEDPEGRKPQNEVDRFLEEINRLRRQSTEQQPQAAPPRAEPVVPEVRRAPPPRPQPQRRSQEARRAEPRRQTQVAPAAAVVEAVPVAVASKAAPPVRRKMVSPGVSQLFALLRNPATVQTAVVLHEVFGPPKAYRLLSRRPPG